MKSKRNIHTTPRDQDQLWSGLDDAVENIRHTLPGTNERKYYVEQLRKCTDTLINEYGVNAAEISSHINTREQAVVS